MSLPSSAIQMFILPASKAKQTRCGGALGSETPLLRVTEEDGGDQATSVKTWRQFMCKTLRSCCNEQLLLVYSHVIIKHIILIQIFTLVSTGGNKTHCWKLMDTSTFMKYYHIFHNTFPYMGFVMYSIELLTFKYFNSK